MVTSECSFTRVEQITCLKKEYHIINNATKTSLIKYITAEQRPRMKNGKDI